MLNQIIGNQKKILVLFFWFLPAAGLVLALCVAAEGRESYGSLSSDELFEKSMAQLRATMEKARQGNEELKAKNRALQDSLDSLEQALDQAQSDKNELQKEALKITDEATLQEKENSLSQQRLKNLAMDQSRLAEENQYFEEKIKALVDDDQKAQGSIGALKEEVSGLASNLRADQRQAPHKKIRENRSDADLKAKISEAGKLKNKLTKSQAAVQELQARVDALQQAPPVLSAPDPRLQKLSSQVTDLAKQLQQLRDEQKMLAGPVPPPQEAIQLKEAIAQLGSRRAILADSLKAINGQYRSQDLSVQGLGTQEAQLKGYLDVLENENAALQEKLLTLQMQQDKKNSPSQ